MKTFTIPMPSGQNLLVHSGVRPTNHHILELVKTAISHYMPFDEWAAWYKANIRDGGDVVRTEDAEFEIVDFPQLPLMCTCATEEDRYRCSNHMCPNYPRIIRS